MKIAALFLVSSLVATPAFAQRAPGSLGIDRMNPPTLDQLTDGREMNECQMRPNRAVAEALLASSTLAEATAHAARFTWQPCVLRKRALSTMKVEPNTPSLDELRLMSADYLLAGNPGATTALAPRPRQSAYALPWFAASARADSIDAMAACVADSDPQGIVRLQATVIGSVDERASLAALAPTLTDCLQAGVTLNGNRKALRGALLDALYQRARAETVRR